MSESARERTPGPEGDWPVEYVCKDRLVAAERRVQELGAERDGNLAKLEAARDLIESHNGRIKSYQARVQELERMRDLATEEMSGAAADLAALSERVQELENERIADYRERVQELESALRERDYLLGRAERYIGEHKPTEDLQYEIRSVLSEPSFSEGA